MTTRERKIEYIKKSGPKTLDTLLSEMVAINGEDWLTDEQVEEMTNSLVKTRRSNQHRWIANRRNRKRSL